MYNFCQNKKNEEIHTSINRIKAQNKIKNTPNFRLNKPFLKYKNIKSELPKEKKIHTNNSQKKKEKNVNQ